MNREDLHTDAENYNVWCERCQRVHRHFTFTREDYDRVMAEGAQAIADQVDRMAAEAVYKTMN